MSVRRLSKPSRIPSNRFALEPRIVFDGAMPVAAAAGAAHAEAASGDHAHAVERAPTEHTNIAHAPATPSTATPVPQRLQPPIDKGLGTLDQLVVDESGSAAPAVHEIAFVDDSVKDIESYLPGFKGLVVTLSAGSDGVDQIAQTLAGMSGLTAIHIISHGGSGFLSLGTASLDATTAASRYAADLAQIGAALTRDGDILLYGCDVAAGPSGQSFIEQIAAATQADVAASTDDTGATRLGGNWTLEAHTGPIEAQAIDPVGYDALLAAPTLFLGGAATTNYSASYVENAQPSAIAAAADTITQTGGSGNLQSATIQITNAQAGDVLTQIGPISSNITQSFYNSSTGTLTLTGTDTYAHYAAAIRAIGFASESENPSGTSRTISVVVNDGTTNSNTAVTTIAVTPVNDAPVITVAAVPNLLTDGDFENTLQPNINGNNLQGTSYGGFTATAQINIVHVNGAGYLFAPDLAESGVQYLDLAGDGTIQQTFTLATATTVTFGGSFANREPFSPGYVTPTTSIQIFNSGGTQVGSTVTPTIPIVPASGSETWYDASGSVSLAAGTYTFRVNLGDYAQVDNLYVRPGLSNAVSYTENAAPTLIAAAATASDVDNANLTGATITLTNAASLDVLSVVGTLPTGITASSYDPATGILTLSGSATVAAYQSAIRQIGYSSTSENPSATPRTVTVTVNDGTTTSATATTTIAVIPVNDPPNAVADSFGTPHDTPYTLDVRANDSDAENDPLTVTKVNGTAVTAGGASVAVTGGQVALTTQGNLLFTPTAGFTGSTSFTYAVSDGNGGESTATVSGSVTDTAPVVDLNSGSTSTQRITNGTFTGGASGWTATGDGFAQNNVYYWSTNGSTGTLTQTGLTGLNSGYGTSGAAQLTFDLGWNNGVPDSTVPATLDLSIAGVVYARLTTSSDNANGTVGSITYLNGASGPTSSITSSPYLAWTYTNIVINLPANVAASGALLFSYSAGTGGGDDISIDNVSVLTRTDSVAGNNYSTSYTENGAPLSIAAAGSEVRDNDGNVITAATVTLTNAQAGDVLSVIGTLPTGITASAYNAGTGVITLSGSATLAQYATAIRQIGYSSTSHNPSTVDRTINVVVSDGIQSSTTSTTTISVTAVNDAPTSTAPTTVSSAEDTTLSFTSGNALSVADVDSPNLTVSLNVAHGTLTLGTTTGLTFTTGNGTANTAMTFSGTQAQLNAALASLTYRPAADYNGSDTLGFSTSDGSLTTSKSVALTTTAVADITADNVTTNENAAISFNAITGTNGATADTFSDPGRAVTSVTQGAHGSVTFNADGTLVYTPNTNYSGNDVFTYTVTAGGTTETATEAVTVGAVNQAPTSVAPTVVSSAEDTTVAFTGGNALSVADVDSPNLSVTLNVAHGTLTLGTTTGLTFTTGNGTANTAMTFGGTQAQLNAALASLTYRPAADYNGSDTLGFSTSDGSLTTSKSVALTTTAVADITADNVTTNENAAISFNAITGTNGATADTFSDPGRAVTSVTQGAHGSVSFNANGTLTYTPNANYSGTDTFTYTVTAGGTTETATETVTINAVNQAPTSTAPASVTTNEDTTLSFTGGNALSVADVDSPNLTVSLNVAHGTLTLGTTTGLTFTTGNGTANTAMTFSGTQAQINNALASLSFKPNPDFNGSDALGFSTSDGSLTTARSVALTITPVADITADNVTTNEDSAISFNAITGTNGATADTFSDPGRTITSVTQGLHGTVSFTAAGVLTYTPVASFYGSDSYSYTVSAGGSTETASVTMTVVHVNHAPVANSDSFTVAEDATATINVRANDTDADNDPLTVTQVNGQAISAGGAGIAITGGTITLGSGSDLVYTPTAFYRGSTSFTYTVADPSGATSTATVTGTVTPVNHAPTVANDVATIDEDHGTSGNVLVNDSDPDGDPLTVASVNGNAANVGATVAGSNGGLFTIQSNGSYAFATNGQFVDLGAGQSRTTSVTYVAGDGQGGTSTATITITVTGVNDVPVANADTYDTTDTSGSPSGLPASNNVLTNDTDAEHDPLVVTAVNGSATQVGAPTLGSYGTLTLNANGTFTYAVDRSNAAVLALLRGQAPLIDQFTYTQSDGHGGTASTTLTVRVNGTNDGPIAGNDSNAIIQGQASATGNVITGVRTDGSGTTTTVPSATDTDPGFTLNVDAIRLPAETSGTIVTPSATGSRTGQYGTITIDTNGNYTYSLNNGSAAVRALVPGQLATESFVYSVSDGVHATEATITISIDGRNDPPIAQNDSFVTAQGSPATINVRANDSDPENDPIRVTAINGTALTAGGAGVAVTGGVVTLNTSGDLVYTPAATYRGSPSFTYTIEDPSGATATGTVGGTVTPVNHAPTAVADVFGSPENTVATINVVANDSDADGNAIAVTQINGNNISVGGPGIVVNGGVVTLTASGSLVFTPDNNFVGSVSFGYTLADPSGATASATVSGMVTHVNQPPVAVADQFTSPQNATATINVRTNDSDPDGDALTVTQVNGTAITAGGAAVAVTGGTVVLDTAGNLEFTPTGNFRGPTSFSYTVSDPFGATGSATVSGTVTPFNHPPVAAAERFSVTQGSVATINALADATDPDGDPLTITQVNGLAITAGGAGVAVSGGTVRLDGAGNMVFTPTPGYLGATTFSYTVVDPSGATASAAISGMVLPSPNHPPIANPDSFTIPTTMSATIDVRTNDTDADNDPLTVTQINGSAIVAGGPGVTVTGGVVTLNSAGIVVFTPTANYSGPTAFTYTLVDPSGATATASVAGTVTPVADAPIVRPDSATTLPNTVVTIDVLANDSGVDGPLNPASVQLAGTANPGDPLIVAGQGTYTINPTNGAITFTPLPGFRGTPAVGYTVADTFGSRSAPVLLSLSVGGPDRAPEAVADAFTTSTNMATTIDVRANDSDPDGDPLTVTRINGTAITAGGAGVAVSGGVVTLNAAGNLVFMPTANTSGAVSFSYTVADPLGATSTATVSVTVNGTPTAVADTVSGEIGVPLSIDVLANDLDSAGNRLTIIAIDGHAIVAGSPGVAVAGGVVTLDASGKLLFTPAAGSPLTQVSFSYTASDPSGLQSSAGVTLNLGTARNPEQGPAGLPVVASPLAAGPSFTPSPALVIQSVDDVRSEQATYGSFGTFPSDVPTAAEIAAGSRGDAMFESVDATSGIGLIQRDANLFREGIVRNAETLFVQHAVRYEALADAHALYVQTAVQQTQAEALAIQLRAAGTNSAVLGSTTLLDPFSIGAPAIVVPAAGGSAPTPPSGEGKRTEADRDVREDVVSIDALTIATGRSASARGFSVQLKDSASRLHVARASADRRSPVVVGRDQNVAPSAPDAARR
jgi:VCBS repeat-containing protein